MYKEFLDLVDKVENSDYPKFLKLLLNKGKDIIEKGNIFLDKEELTYNTLYYILTYLNESIDEYSNNPIVNIPAIVEITNQISNILPEELDIKDFYDKLIAIDLKEIKPSERVDYIKNALLPQIKYRCDLEMAYTIIEEYVKEYNYLENKNA